jgi:quercetin dioxygenase-like cupin family protein
MMSARLAAHKGSAGAAARAEHPHELPTFVAQNNMGLSALVITRVAVEGDPALQPDSRGARKLLVTDLYSANECEATSVQWVPPVAGEKCPVLVVAGAEMAVFNQHATQDRHYHKQGIETFMVIDGVMVIEVDGQNHSLSSGDMIVVNPNAVHKIRSEGTKFICRVVTLNCGGESDKFVSERAT